MNRKTNENSLPNNRFFILAEDMKSLLDIFSSEKDLTIIDTFPQLNLITIETSEMRLTEIEEKIGQPTIDRKCIDKIEPSLLDRLKADTTDQDGNVSTLVDLELYGEEDVKQLQEQEGVVVEKEYPFLSSIHISFPAKNLIKIAQLANVKRISDSEGDIRLTRGDTNGQN